MLPNSLLFEVRQVVRSLRRRPAYVAASVATLALVLAANATLFATINATLFRPVPFRSGEATVAVYTMPPGLHDAKFRNPLHAVDLVRFRERARILRDISGFTVEDRALTGGAEPEVVHDLVANASLFRLISDQPVLGRAFTEEEEERGAHVTVITHDLWQRRFGGDRAVLGKTLDLDGAPYTIVGVMPASFPPPALLSNLITPLGITRNVPAANNPNRTYLVTLARIADGATLAQAAADLGIVMEQVVRENPRSHVGWTSGVLTYRDWQYGKFQSPLIALFGAMALLMLIASANIASLTLAGVSARKGEIALRRAIGASPAAIARLIVVEVGMLNLAGAAIGVAIAVRLLPLLLAIDPNATKSLGAVSIDWRVVGYAFASALAAAAISSLVPALNAADNRIAAQGFGSSNSRTHGSRAADRWRSLLLVGQTALCLVLLVSGGLLLRALTRSTKISPGFDAAHVLTAQLRLPAERYSTPQSRVTIMEQLFARLGAIPGVVNVSQTMNRFTPGQSYVTLVDIEGQQTTDGSARTVQFRRVSPAYFATMRIRVLRGRTFTTQDSPTSTPAIVISRLFAEQFWHGEDPVGRQVQQAGKPLTIIGVVDDVSDVDLLQQPEATLYRCWAQSNNALNPVGLVVRTAGDPLSMASVVRSAILSVDPGLPVDRVQPLETFLDDSLAPQRFRATLLSVLAAVGLLLGAVGVAGVTARSIAERMSEFGVRLALGCDQGALWRSAIARQVRLVIAGAALGAVLSIAAGRFLAYLLPEIGPLDPVAMGAAAAVLLLTSAAAASIPASKVLHLDPIAVLRN